MGCGQSKTTVEPIESQAQMKTSAVTNPYISPRGVTNAPPVVENRKRVEEKTVEDNFDYEAPDVFKMDVTETALKFAENNTITKCCSSMGGTVHIMRPIRPNQENHYRIGIVSSKNYFIYIGIESVDKEILEGRMGDAKE